MTQVFAAPSFDRQVSRKRLSIALAATLLWPTSVAAQSSTQGAPLKLGTAAPAQLPRIGLLPATAEHQGDAHTDASSTSWGPGERSSGHVGDALRPPDPKPQPDGIYGRLDGDLVLSLGVGPAYSDSGFGVGARATAHYFYTAGLTASYLGGVETGPSPQRYAAGLDIRPLFLPRWAQDLEKGPALLDLALDSLSFGAELFRERATEPSRNWSSGLACSLGLGIPFTHRAPGPWLELRVLRQWPVFEQEQSNASSTLWLGFSWHVLVETPLIDPYEY